MNFESCQLLPESARTVADFLPAELEELSLNFGCCRIGAQGVTALAARVGSDVNIELNHPPKLGEARSLLHRRRFLQPSTHFAAFFEIFKIYKPLHRSRFKIYIFLFSIFSKICRNFHDFYKILLKSPLNL